jgi:hypothetical protein
MTLGQEAAGVVAAVGEGSFVYFCRRQGSLAPQLGLSQLQILSWGS